MRIEQVSGSVQADGCLARAGCALDADAVRQVGAHQLVLFGLDGRDDVAHRSDAGPLDLGGENGARCRVLLLATVEVLLLIAGEHSVREAEPSPERDTHGHGRARSVERTRDARPPVDDHRVALGVTDMPPADVEALLAFLVDVSTTVDATEEQRCGGVVEQRLGAAEELRLQVLGRDPVAALGVERADGFAHRFEAAAGVDKGLAFGRERIGAVVILRGAHERETLLAPNAFGKTCEGLGMMGRCGCRSSVTRVCWWRPATPASSSTPGHSRQASKSSTD